MTYTARALRPAEDRDALLALWMEVMARRSERAAAERRYAWFFEQNPAGPPTMCVTHHVESGALIACGAAYPHRTQLGGESHAAGIMSDFAVSRSHRVAGAALAVQRQLLIESLGRFDFIYGCPNQQAEPIFKRLGFQTVGTTVSFSRPLRTADKLERYLGSSVAARIAGGLVDRALALTDARVQVRHPFAFRGEALACADERFDELWERARGHYGITGERTRAYLNWRYAAIEAAPHRFFAVSHRRGRDAGRLCGYVVYSVKDDVVLVDDIFCDRPGALLEVVLLLFAAEMRDGKHRSIYLTALLDGRFRRILTRCLFIERPGGKSLIARAREQASPAFTSELLAPGRWYMIGGEIDT